MTTASPQVLVVGGGAAGVITAATLLRGTARSAVTVVERPPVAGPGLAYATTDPHHLLNNYAARMSAVEDDPAHLVRWCWSQGLDVDGAHVPAPRDLRPLPRRAARRARPSPPAPR